MNYPEHLRKKDRENGDVFAIMTRELRDRKLRKFGQKPLALSHDGYHLKYNGIQELEDLERQYPVGGTYNNEEILSTCVLNSKSFGG